MNAKLKALQQIPGIGKTLAVDLYAIGIEQVTDLVKCDPQDLYERYELMKGFPADPCVLYTFRCAIYFARTKHPDPELLKWWNWKGKELH
ncbi:helix-hairpin-helix domain-containing protein [Culicoidibacter larvae]|uniref:Pathogenicity locus n=1 Tax=Culicoidibacter larvae TaxID=2579976 RepID=A0A5R8QIG1_9FIRM|nr:helix-hairpin-helix domain-containing protein [Culicoidibacter larvae]TLG77470.1 pathogenicity locus [Culicoidibacter larvae]